jgi:hypothetical protein
MVGEAQFGNPRVACGLTELGGCSGRVLAEFGMEVIVRWEKAAAGGFK